MRENIILSIAVVILLSITIACKDVKPSDGNIIVSEYPKPFKLYYTQGIKQGESGIVQGSDKHEYLIIDYGYSNQSISHYVDCELCLSRKLNYHE